MGEPVLVPRWHFFLLHRKQPQGKFPPNFFANKNKKTQASTRIVHAFYRDIVYLLKLFVKRGEFIQLPRKKDDRVFLVTNKFIGKVRLKSNMHQDEILRSVFKSPMRFNDNFQFTILQSSGGDSKGLMIPELSASYMWTATAIVGKNAKVLIYILAEDDLLVCFFTFKQI